MKDVEPVSPMESCKEEIKQILDKIMIWDIDFELDSKDGMLAKEVYAAFGLDYVESKMPWKKVVSDESKEPVSPTVNLSERDKTEIVNLAAHKFDENECPDDTIWNILLIELAEERLKNKFRWRFEKFRSKYTVGEYFSRMKIQTDLNEVLRELGGKK